MATMIAVTRQGLYVSPDSVSYVGTARSLLDGRGWTPPPGLPELGHFPPLFIVALAGVGRLGFDPLDAARIVNVIAFGGVVALVGVVLWRRTASVAAALVGSLLVLVAVDLLTFSAAALSEPLFIVLGLAAMVALAAHLERRRPALFVVAGALVAAAVLTRYVGVALVVAGMATIVRFGGGRRFHAALDSLVFAAIGVVPALAWMAWAGRGNAPAGERTVVHLPGLGYLGQAAQPVGRWTMPFVPPAVGLTLAALVVVGCAALLRRQPLPSTPAAAPRSAPPARPELSALPWLLSAFVVSYLGVLVADRAFLDASGRLDARFLVPLHVVAVVLVVPPLYRAVQARRVPVAALAVGAALVVLQIADAAVWTADGLTDVGVGRRGYTASAWRTSRVLAAIAAADPDQPVYTNGFDALYFLTGRQARPLPAEKDYLTGRANPRYPEELALLGRSGGLVAYFGALTARRSFLPSQASLERALPLQRVESDDVGTLYRLDLSP